MDHRDELPDLTPDEERLLGLLVEYDQGLADGTITPAETQQTPEVDSELADQFVRGKHLLDLMATVAGQQDDEEFSPQTPVAIPSSEAAATPAVQDEFFSALEFDGQTPARLGRFIIERELGVGGHGMVFLAFDPVLKRQVALKVPRSEATVSAALRRRFLREARAAARLTHPNLVSVYEVGEAGRLGYIAAAFCPGPSLAAWINERGKPLAPREAAELLVQFAEAVHYAHSQGVLHRDIKPSNVLLEPLTVGDGLAAGDGLSFVPKLVDFGLAKLEDIAGADTLSGVAMGTPGYMAPEQVEGRLDDIDARTDVYGLGTVLYEALAGARPFSGSSDAELMQRILTEDPAPPSRTQSGIGVDIEAICLKCLEKRPDRRYATAQALADDLRRFLAGEPIVARRVTRFERLVRLARRNPGVATLTAAVLLLLTALAVASTVAAVRIDRALEKEQEARQQAQREATRAEAEAARAAAFAEQAQSESETAQSVAIYLEGMFRSADPVGLEGFRFRPQVDRTSDLTAADILRQGADRLDADLAEQPAVQAKLMSVIGSVYVTLGMLREAEPLLVRSLQIRETLYGEKSAQTADSLHNLATLRFATFDFSAAKRLLARALAIRLELLGPADPDTVRTKFNLAWLVITNGQETRPEKIRMVPLMEEVVQFHRRESDSPIRYAFALLGLAMLRYEVDERPLQAAALMAEANRVLSQNGNSDIGAGFMLMLRSYVQRRMGNGRAAVASVESAIDRMRKAVGDNHPVLVWPHFFWAEALIGSGEYDKALEVYRETVALCERLYGSPHRTIGMTVARMAEPMILMKNLAGAEAALRQALDILRQDDGNFPNRTFCVHELLLVLERQDRTSDANELCQQELRAARELSDEPDSRAFLAAMLAESAQVEIALGHWLQAQQSLEEAISLEEAALGSQDPTVQDLLAELARVQLAQDNLTGYRATCYRLLNSIEGETSAKRLRNVVWTCVLVPDAVDDPRQLVALAERALSRSPSAPDSQRVLGAALYRAGRHDEAVERLNAALPAREKQGNWADEAWLAIAHARAGSHDEATSWLDKLREDRPLAPATPIAKRRARLERIERDSLLEEARQLLSIVTTPESDKASQSDEE